MQITHTPQRRDDDLDVAINGDVLSLNGALFDFSQIPEGGRLRQEQVGCSWLASDVLRLNGEIHLTLIEPQGSQLEEAEPVA